MIYGDGKVHCVDVSGRPVYNRLLDKPGNVVPFASGNGLLTRHLIKRNSWRLEPGWFDSEEWEAVKRRLYPNLADLFS